MLMKDLFDHDAESNFSTEIGFIAIKSRNDFLTELKISPTKLPSKGPSTPLHIEVEKQLNAYLSGQLRDFDLPLAPSGTLFQKEIWSLLTRIPFGKTITYTMLAQSAGDVLKTRAVANANACNPIWVIIPCHRVIGKDGNLRGYAGGINLKEKLLRLEGVMPPALW